MINKDLYGFSTYHPEGTVLQTDSTECLDLIVEINGSTKSFISGDDIDNEIVQ